MGEPRAEEKENERENGYRIVQKQMYKDDGRPWK